MILHRWLEKRTKKKKLNLLSPLVFLFSLSLYRNQPANLIHWGFESPVQIEIQPCGEVPIQPLRSLLQRESETCPKHCLMRFKVRSFCC